MKGTQKSSEREERRNRKPEQCRTVRVGTNQIDSFFFGERDDAAPPGIRARRGGKRERGGHRLKERIGGETEQRDRRRKEKRTTQRLRLKQNRHVQARGRAGPEE